MRPCFALCLLMLVVAACQPVASAPPAPAPPPARAAPVSAVVWAEVPRQICTCHEDALSRVETAVQDSQLAVEFKIESGNEGWHIFTVTYDPTRVAAERVAQLLEVNGALIIPAPVAH